jgi:hypothetical protein
VKRDLMRHYEAQHQRAARDGAMLYATFFFWAPLTVLAAGDRRGAWYFGLMTALFAATSLTLLRASKLPYSAASGSYLTIGMTSVTLSSLSGLLGPLLLVPSLVMMNAIGFLLRPDRGRRRAVLVASLAAIAIPQLLEWTGLVPPSSLIERGHVIILPRILKFTPATHLTLFFATLGLIVAFALFFARFRESLTRAEERLSVHAWQLRQLLPDAQAR